MFKVLFLSLAILFSVAGSISNAALSKDEIKEYSKFASLSDLSFDMDDKAGEFEIEVSCDDYDEWLASDKKIGLRLIAQVENEKKVKFLAKENVSLTVRDEFIPEYFEIDIKLAAGDFRKLKLVSYVLQLGMLDGSDFIVFEEEAKKAKSYEELEKSGITKFPNKISYSYTSHGERDD